MEDEPKAECEAKGSELEEGDLEDLCLPRARSYCLEEGDLEELG